MHLLSTAYIVFSILGAALARFDSTSKTNLAVYWGQNSAGGKETQDRLSTYCANEEIDIVMLSFLVAVNGTGGQPILNFANQQAKCNESSTPFTCPEIGDDIKKCQEKGKTVLLSVGGQTSSENGFANEKDAKAAAEKVWQMFGPDQSKDIIRPFDSAVVDGFDLDIERDVPNMVAFAKELRNQMDKDTNGSKRYLSAAPSCEMPNLNEALLENVTFDMLFVQFYNNKDCDTRKPNFEAWNGLADTRKTTFFVGLPAGETAASSGGYMAHGLLKDTLATAKGLNKMAGAMLWDASQAWANDAYHKKVKSALKDQAGHKHRIRHMRHAEAGLFW